MIKLSTSVKSAALVIALLSLVTASATADEIRKPAAITEAATFDSAEQSHPIATVQGPTSRAEGIVLLSDANLDVVTAGYERHSAEFWGQVALTAGKIYCGVACSVW